MLTLWEIIRYVDQTPTLQTHRRRPLWRGYLARPAPYYNRVTHKRNTNNSDLICLQLLEDVTKIVSNNHVEEVVDRIESKILELVADIDA